MSPFWVTFILGLTSVQVQAWQHHHKAEQCPNGWKEKPFLCYTDSHREYDFSSALIYCLNQQRPSEWNGQFYGLISVGQLRHFKNRYPYADSVNRHHHHFQEQRIFRVNARKSAQGVWTEFGASGKEVQFHHYPGFNSKAGHVGDTLIWDSKEDKLYTAHPQETFHVLCASRPSDRCKECPDAQWENECNNAGDCLDGICQCDVGFEGYKCQVAPLEDSNLDLIVYAGNPANPSQKYSLERNVTCAIDEFPVELENLVSGQAFGRPIACGGNSLGGSAVNQCYIYRHQTWLPEVSLMVPRSQAAGTVINNGKRDLIYWVTFGEDDQGNDLSSTEYLSWYGEAWKTGPSLPSEYARKGHCAVQINKIEAAILGGVSAGSTYRDDILIFNFEDAKWKVGPMLPTERSNLACAVIQDDQSDHSIVISACGTGASGPETVVEKWDLTTWETSILPYTCPSGVDFFDSAWPISDHEIIFTTGSGNSQASEGIWSFTLEFGFRKIDHWPNGRTGAGSALLSKDYVECKY